MKGNNQFCITNQVFVFKQSLSGYYMKCGIHIIAGLVLGICIEQLCKKIQSTYHISPTIMAIFQLTLIVTVLYIIEVHISEIFSLEWQNITPGFIFVSLFFNLQGTLVNNINAAISNNTLGKFI